MNIQLIQAQIIKININQMQNQQSNMFLQICSKVSNKLYFEELMIKQQQVFDIQPYKIDKLYSQSAKKLYKQISFKYQGSKQLMPLPNVWHQNQRKIFIWFIVCYFYQIGVQDPLEVDVDWEKLCGYFFNKTSSFLKFQFLNIIKLKKRINWSAQQDSLLTKATYQQGVGKWNQISKYIFFNSNCCIFKSPKHCRQRWLNHLDGNKNKGRWTDVEDYKIFLYVRQSGKKWSKIVQVLSNTRTQHMVKNRFNSLLSKHRKNKKQKQIQTIDKIIKNLSKTLGIDCQATQKLENRTELIDYQLQNQQQSGINMLYQKENQKISKVRNCKIISKKTTDQISSFQTMPMINSQTFSNKYEPISVHIQNRENMRHLDWLYCEHNDSPIRMGRGSGLSIFEVEQNIKQQFWDQSDQRVQACYKTKPVYIIQKNF